MHGTVSTNRDHRLKKFRDYSFESRRSEFALGVGRSGETPTIVAQSHASSGGTALKVSRYALHPGGNPGANIKSIPHRCYLREVFESELTEETTDLPLGCLEGGLGRQTQQYLHHSAAQPG